MDSFQKNQTVAIGRNIGRAKYLPEDERPKQGEDLIARLREMQRAREIYQKEKLANQADLLNDLSITTVPDDPETVRNQDINNISQGLPVTVSEINKSTERAFQSLEPEPIIQGREKNNFNEDLDQTLNKNLETHSEKPRKKSRKSRSDRKKQSEASANSQGHYR